MSAPLQPPPLEAQPFDLKRNRFSETWQRWFIKLFTQVAAAFAPIDGSYVVTGNVPGLINQFDLGLLTDGILKQTVVAAIATPAIAVAGTDYTALAFERIAVSGQSDVVADSPADTLTLVAGSGIAITTSAAGDSVTIAASGSSGIDELTGDVTAGPGSGSQVATIANDAVTYAKMQNVSAASRVLGRGSAAGAGNVEELTLGTGLSMSGTVLSASGTMTQAIVLTVDGQGVVLTTGVKGYFQVPVTCTIVSWTILSVDATPTSGAIVFDIWNVAYASYPPVVGNSITPSAKPTITASGIKNTSTSVGAWTTAITAGDCLGFNVDSVSSFTKVVLEIVVTVP